MEDLKIVWDIDGVQADFSQHFIQYGIEQRWFTDDAPPTSWDDARFRDNMKKLDGYDEFWLGIPSIIDYKELVKIPGFQYPVGHLTSRNLHSAVTSMWLYRNKAPAWSQVYTVPMGESKVDELELLEADLLVDDGLHNFEEVNNSDIKCTCVLVTRPHNVHANVHNRVNNLYDFYQNFLPEWIEWKKFQEKYPHSPEDAFMR